MTHANGRPYTRTELQAVAALITFILLVSFIGSVHAAQDEGLLDGTGLGDKLATGSAQTVLSVALLGVSGACIYLAKRLFAENDKRIEDRDKRDADRDKREVEERKMYNDVITRNTDSNNAVAAALTRCEERSKGNG